jgi:hypothetical protein
MQCVFCGCTDERACVTPVEELPPAVLAFYVTRYGFAEDTLPATLPCTWISTDPPICSAPACIAASVSLSGPVDRLEAQWG